MKLLLCLILCVACVQAREYVCLELLNVNIAFNQKNVPERFKFSFNDNVITSDVNVLYPIQKSVDYDGVVQLKSKDAIRTFHISYEDPGETKTLDSADVVPVKSLKGKVDSVAVSELWGTGNSKISSTKSAAKNDLSPKFWDDVQNNIDLSDCY